MTRLRRRRIKVSPEVKKKTNRVSIDVFIEALELSGGFYTETARMLGISVAAVGQRIKKSETLQKKLKEIEHSRLDLAETVVMNKLRLQSLSAAKWYLDRKGKIRGYTDKKELDANITTPSGILSVPIDLSRLSDKELDVVISLAEKVQGV